MKPSLASFCLLCASLATAGMSIPEIMTLDQLVQQASLVVVVVPDTLPAATRTVDLGPSTPPFSYVVRRFRVLETLRGAVDPATTRIIQTVDPDVETLLYLEREGLSKSFYSPSFPPGEGLLDKRDTLILFLYGKNDRGEHPFVADNACAPHSRKSQIRKTLSRTP